MTGRACVNNHLTLSVLFLISLLTFPGHAISEQEVVSEEGVQFIVPVEVGIFGEHAILTARLWNAKQLAISEKIDECTMTHDMDTETERIECPEGITYEKPRPEEFSFPVQEIVSSLELRSHTIKVGDRYRLRISGTSRDNCNTTSAESTGVADSELIQVRQLSWSSTLMGCP
jgi:hypothetical protein